MKLKVIVAAIVAVLIVGGLAAVFLFDEDETRDSGLNVSGSPNNQYTINFDSNGGGSNPPSQTSIYNYYIALPTDVSRSGYILTGWNTSSSGNGISYTPGALYLVTGNTTLYAVWTKTDAYYDGSIPNKTTASTQYSYSPSLEGEALATKPGLSSGNLTWAYFRDRDMQTVSGGALTFELKGTAASWLSYTISKETHPNYYTFKGITFSGVPTASGVYSVEFRAYLPTQDITTLCYKWYITVSDASSGDYTVTFTSNGGTGSIADKHASYNNLVELPGYSDSLPTKDGYTLAGWEDPNGATWNLGSFYPVTSNTVLRAKWIGNANVVVFDATGSFVKSGSSAYAVYTGSSVSMPDSSNLTKTGHTFLGWYNSVNPNQIYDPNYTLASVSGDTIFCAYWVPNGTSTVAVTYDANGGNGFTRYSIESGKYSVSPVLGFNKDGYSHVGWNTKSDGSGTHYDLGDAIRVTANTTLYAEWTAGSSGGDSTYYKVYFDLNGGTGNIGTQEVLSSECAVRPSINPTKAGHIFVGWSMTGDPNKLFDFNTQIKNNVTLKAVWNQHFVLINNGNKLTIHISQIYQQGSITGHTVNWGNNFENSFSVSGTIESPEFTPGVSGRVTVTTTLENGQSLQSSRMYYIASEGGSDNTVHIIFKSTDGGKGYQEISISKGTQLALPSAGFVKDGYVLDGWGLNQIEKTHSAGEIYTADEDVVFFTVWKENSIAGSDYAAAIIAIIIGVIGIALTLYFKQKYFLLITVAAVVAIILAYLGGFL